MYFKNFNISFLIPVNVSKIAGWVANSADPGRTPHSAASDQGLHSLLKPVCPNTWWKYEYNNLIKSNPFHRDFEPLLNNPVSASESRLKISLTNYNKKELILCVTILVRFGSIKISD